MIHKLLINGLRILTVLTNHLSLVAVVSKDEDNAANVFETLNDRGIGLSTPDLVRNLVLRRASPSNLDEIIDLWGVILGIEGGTNLKSFFRHYWISREGDIKTQSLYREIKRKIVEENIDSLNFSRSLSDSSYNYKVILSGSDDDEETSKYLNDIKLLGANLLYPAILILP